MAYRLFTQMNVSWKNWKHAGHSCWEVWYVVAGKGRPLKMMKKTSDLYTQTRKLRSWCELCLYEPYAFVVHWAQVEILPRSLYQDIEAAGNINRAIKEDDAVQSGVRWVDQPTIQSTSTTKSSLNEDSTSTSSIEITKKNSTFAIWGAFLEVRVI